MVYALSFRVTRDHHDADTITQETFIKAYRKLASFQGRAEFKTWLYRIAVRTGLDFLRRRRARPPQASLDGSAEDPSDDAPTPDRAYEAQQLHRMLLDAIDELPEKQRMAITLVTQEEMTYREAAAAMACSPGTLAWRVARARERLQAVLGPHLESRT